TDRSGIGAQQAHYQLEHGRLAGAVRADQAASFARGQRQGDAVGGDDAAEAAANAFQDEQRHFRLPDTSFVATRKTVMTIPSGAAIMPKSKSAPITTKASSPL